MNKIETVVDSMNYLELVIAELEKATRQGSDIDYPEGSRFVTISDTLMNEMIKNLKSCALIAKK